jgi:hypothetical protein
VAQQGDRRQEADLDSALNLPLVPPPPHSFLLHQKACSLAAALLIGYGLADPIHHLGVARRLRGQYVRASAFRFLGSLNVAIVTLPRSTLNDHYLPMLARIRKNARYAS